MEHDQPAPSRPTDVRDGHDGDGRPGVVQGGHGRELVRGARPARTVDRLAHLTRRVDEAEVGEHARRRQRQAVQQDAHHRRQCEDVAHGRVADAVPAVEPYQHGTHDGDVSNGVVAVHQRHQPGVRHEGSLQRQLARQVQQSLDSPQAAGGVHRAGRARDRSLARELPERVEQQHTRHLGHEVTRTLGGAQADVEQMCHAQQREQRRRKLEGRLPRHPHWDKRYFPTGTLLEATVREQRPHNSSVSYRRRLSARRTCSSRCATDN